jgi:uncharacterized repeat protein (TIGR03803 family)
MTGNRSVVLRAVGMFAAVLVLSGTSLAQVSEQVIYNFTGKSGMSPNSRLVQDSSGRLYGTTLTGGDTTQFCLNTGCGVVFALAPKKGGGWRYGALYAFTGGADGAVPGTNLLLDGAGNLYGVATLGGIDHNGVVFKLSPATGGHWTETVIYSFNPANGSDGSGPSDGLTADAAGNLYGTTQYGGPQGFGTVFKLTPNADGSWSESVLYGFNAPTDGCTVAGGVVFDNTGNLYGTTTFCGAFGLGNVFQLSLNSSGDWTENILYSFSGCCPNNPSGPLLLDATGNVYGTGPNPGGGYIYQLVKGSGGSWTENIIYTFRSQDGSEPAGGLVADIKGNLYGATLLGGTQFGNGNGVVFKLTPHPDGRWTESVLYAFADGSDGLEPMYGVSLGKGGVIYGTTFYGGSAGDGTVFKLTPTP